MLHNSLLIYTSSPPMRSRLHLPHIEHNPSTVVESLCVSTITYKLYPLKNAISKDSVTGSRCIRLQSPPYPRIFRSLGYELEDKHNIRGQWPVQQGVSSTFPIVGLAGPTSLYQISLFPSGRFEEHTFWTL